MRDAEIRDPLPVWVGWFILFERRLPRVALGSQALERGRVWDLMVKVEGRPRFDSSPTGLDLHENEVHVWLAPLDRSTVEVCELEQLLSDDERLRAGGYYFGRDRRRFVVGRGLLRVILSGYVHASPERLTFRCGPKGKPALSGPWQGGLEFNLSHSNGNALYAVTRDRKVGIDLEYIRSLPDAEDIALRCFSARENGLIATAPPSERLRAFFECWTRKEAFIKATGEGLSTPLEEFDASLAPGEEERLLTPSGAPSGEPPWRLRALAPDPAYVGALAVQGEGWCLHCWRWAPRLLSPSGPFAI
jgi:4'-phosphopantetheinyl transferase